MFDDGYSVYLDEYLTKLYDYCSERPASPTLESLIKTHVKCLKKVEDMKKVIIILEKGGNKGKAVLVKGDNIYTLECKDVMDEILKDPDYAYVLATLFEDENIADEVMDAESAIVCTLKKRPMSKKEKEEIKDLIRA